MPRKAKPGRARPGEVRDAIVDFLSVQVEPVSVAEVSEAVHHVLGRVAASSIRSYLRLNSPTLFVRSSRGHYSLRAHDFAQLDLDPVSAGYNTFHHEGADFHLVDCFDWLRARDASSVHAIVTDPPYGLYEYSSEQQAKLRSGRGGVWRIPPSFDGVKRAPLPRFTVLRSDDLQQLDQFFMDWGRLILRVLVPGANVFVASNPLLSYVVSGALARAGLERRGEIIRLTMTMRGGDRPKAAHLEFEGVSVMPRSMWEPWLLFRRPIEGRVQDNLRKWKTGGLRRPSKERPFGDVIASGPTRKNERAIAPHPSLKPQAFLRQIVRAALPLGEGVVLDPFAGSGSTLAAAVNVGYRSIGTEKDPSYFEVGKKAIPALARIKAS